MSNNVIGNTVKFSWFFRNWNSISSQTIKKTNLCLPLLNFAIFNWALNASQKAPWDTLCTWYASEHCVIYMTGFKYAWYVININRFEWFPWLTDWQHWDSLLEMRIKITEYKNTKWYKRIIGKIIYKMMMWDKQRESLLF